ncbi:MAG: hypothetical protein M3N47_08815, partial [Chloroflexota bacterium]|nr:hypothetical protein [Chloroflexota bacterium]
MQHHTTDRISTAMIAALALIFSVPTSQAAATPALRKGDVVAGERSRAILLCIATALLLVVVAAPAGAAPRPDGSDFSCRASAVRAVFPPFPIVQPPTLEPLIANRPGAPCADDAAQIIGAQTVGPAMTETLRVSTAVTPDDLSSRPAADGDNATASSTVERATITGLPAAIAATGLTAEAAFTCTGGQPVGTDSGRVESLTVGGVAVTVPAKDNFVVPLIWGDSLILNQVIVEPTKITRRAMFLDVNGNTGLPDVAISE